MLKQENRNRAQGTFRARARVLVGAISASLVLAGCAHMSQSVTLAPKLDVEATDVGRNVEVGLRVVDERPSQTMGRRGGPHGPSAEISNEQDLAAVIQQSLADGLRKKGFRPVAVKSTNRANLTVELRHLEYSTSQGMWTGGVHVNTAVKAVAARGTESYDHMYRGQQDKNIVFVPGAKSNEKLLNAALNDVLSQVVNDPNLVQFLTQ